MVQWFFKIIFSPYCQLLYQNSIQHRFLKIRLKLVPIVLEKSVEITDDVLGGEKKRCSVLVRLNYGQLTERNWQTDIQYDKDNVVDQTDGERNNSIPYLLRTVQFFLSWKQFAEKINTRILPNLYCVTSTNNNRPCVCYLLIDREWNIHTYITFQFYQSLQMIIIILDFQTLNRH